MAEGDIYRFDAEGDDPIRAMLADAMERTVGARSERYLYEVAGPVLVGQGKAKDVPAAEAMLNLEVGDALLDAFDLIGADHDGAYREFQRILRQLQDYLRI